MTYARLPGACLSVTSRGGSSNAASCTDEHIPADKTAPSPNMRPHALECNWCGGGSLMAPDRSWR